MEEARKLALVKAIESCGGKEIDYQYLLEAAEAIYTWLTSKEPEEDSEEQPDLFAVPDTWQPKPEPGEPIWTKPQVTCVQPEFWPTYVKQDFDKPFVPYHEAVRELMQAAGVSDTVRGTSGTKIAWAPGYTGSGHTGHTLNVSDDWPNPVTS